jgi:hypothetical protein
MTKAEQARIVAWRLKILNWAKDEPRQVARTCLGSVDFRRVHRLNVPPAYGSTA